MRNKFDEQLDNLNNELMTMGALCEDAIALSAKALISADASLIEKVCRVDKEIDLKEREIETLCMKLLLQQQPVAGDLRLITAAIKMVSDMERIGDQAADIAEITEFISPTETHGNIHIADMARATINMVTESVDSFINRDLNLAKKVIDDDDIVDELFCRIKGELAQILIKHPEKSEYCMDILMIAKYFERIGDHATNIAEWVEFSMTGLYKGAPL